jgi:hypothetical protein
LRGRRQNLRPSPTTRPVIMPDHLAPRPSRVWR